MAMSTYIYIYVLYIYINTDPPQVVPTSWGHHAGYAAFCQIEIHQSGQASQASWWVNCATVTGRRAKGGLGEVWFSKAMAAMAKNSKILSES